MRWLRARYRPIILHPDVQHSSVGVGESDHFIDNRVVGNRLSIAFELDVDALTRRNHAVSHRVDMACRPAVQSYINTIPGMRSRNRI